MTSSMAKASESMHRRRCEREFQLTITISSAVVPVIVSVEGRGLARPLLANRRSLSIRLCGMFRTGQAGSSETI